MRSCNCSGSQRTYCTHYACRFGSFSSWSCRGSKCINNSDQRCDFTCSGLQPFSVLRGFIYAACLQPCSAYCSVQGYAKASVHLRYTVLRADTRCTVAEHLPQKQANADSSLAASAQTPPGEQACMLAASSCHTRTNSVTVVQMTQLSIRSTFMHSNTHIVMIFCLSTGRSTRSSFLLGDATHNIVYSQQHDCTLN